MTADGNLWFIIFFMVIPVAFCAPLILVFWPVKRNHYCTDMREHYNDYFKKQLIRQAGVKGVNITK